ncbi:MAG: RNA 2',3'-cyclic phosphodiesterase [Bacteroidia bacterium]|nr:RNA 2',3'-cyclic phosphodiesterase [Bacteroidia bacterium]
MKEMEATGRRLFLGIPPEPSMVHTYEAWRAPVEAHPGVKWTPPEQLHITVYFFGAVPEARLDNLKALLGYGLRAHRPFELRVQGYDWAPPGQEPRMIWVRYQKTEAFRQLAMDIHRMYVQIEPAIQMRHSPVPHMTLARFTSPLAMTLPVRPAMPAQLRVSRLILWESVRSPDGTRYEEIARFLL